MASATFVCKWALEDERINKQIEKEKEKYRKTQKQMYVFNLAAAFSHVHLCLVVILDCIHKIRSYVLLIKSTPVIIRNYTWQLPMDVLYFKSLSKDSYDMSKLSPTPTLMQDSMCYRNPLGSSKTYVDVQKKLNKLKNFWEQNCLVQMTWTECLLVHKSSPDS